MAIGCLSKQGTGRGAPVRYLLTDARSEPPSVYRIGGDPTLLEQHVGHTIEAAGTITPAPATARGSAAAPTLTASSIAWIASSCKK